MVKIHRDISVDGDVYSEFVRVVGRGNVSAKIEEYMNSTLAIFNKDSNSVNIQLLKSEVEQYTKEMSKIRAEVNKRIVMIEACEKQMTVEEQEKLKQEKERIEAVNKCVNCGNMIATTAKRFEFSKGLICKACYMGASADNMKRWSE